jgi:hypothetical protein
MITSSELDKSLQELEQSDRGEPTCESYLVSTVHRSRRVPLRQFTVEDLRIMIGQNIGLRYLLPLAIEQLRKNPFAEGDFYPGDLLRNLLAADSEIWREHPEWHAEVSTIGRRALTRLHAPEPVDGIYTKAILNSLTEAWKVFESAPHEV